MAFAALSREFESCRMASAEPEGPPAPVGMVVDGQPNAEQPVGGNGGGGGSPPPPPPGGAGAGGGGAVDQLSHAVLLQRMQQLEAQMAAAMAQPAAAAGAAAAGGAANLGGGSGGGGLGSILPPMPSFNGSQGSAVEKDWPKWQQKFEKRMEAMRRPTADWVAFALCLMEGNASDWVASKAISAETYNWAEFCSVMLQGPWKFRQTQAGIRIGLMDLRFTGDVSRYLQRFNEQTAQLRDSTSGEMVAYLLRGLKGTSMADKVAVNPLTGREWDDHHELMAYMTNISLEGGGQPRGSGSGAVGGAFAGGGSAGGSKGASKRNWSAGPGANNGSGAGGKWQQSSWKQTAAPYPARDQLSEAERNERLRLKQCFACGSTGHRANDRKNGVFVCPTKRGGAGNAGGSGGAARGGKA